MWQQWTNFVLGLWLILSAFLNFTPSGMMTNLIVVGAAVAILGLWGGAQRSYRYTEERRHSHA